MPARITWLAGGTASIDQLDDDHLEMTSSRAFAPGSRPEATLEPGGLRIWLKVHGSRGQEDGTFRVTGRLLNVNRETREVLKEAVSGAIGGKNLDS